LRLLVLQAHYRSPMTVNAGTLAAATETLRGLDGFARNHPAARDTVPDPDAVARFVERMDDDLDTPQAVALLFDLRREANGAPPERAAALAAAVLALFDAVGLQLGGEEDDAVPAEVAALAATRDEARAARDWARADRIRHDLEADGWTVEDTATGTTIRR
jgi:cysteinyl-tRNA synthetase